MSQPQKRMDSGRFPRVAEKIELAEYKARVRCAMRRQAALTMLFRVDHETLADTVGEDEVYRLSESTAAQYGFTGETLAFLVDTGLPSAEDYEFSFGLPDEFDPGFIWDCAEGREHGWTFPDGVEKVVKIGTFPVNAVVVDPRTGIVYQYTDATEEAIPVHGDLSSLAKTMMSFLGYISSCSPGEDQDEDEEYARRKREVGALTNEIRLVDPLPFSHEYSEWVELFDNLEGGIFT
ncbi:SUKH-4 family immunity protein [Streptomyces sp. NPDC006193]|uniref:SUKH-4 family immunity protein n=1 Tax=Streptomyces sp. NPDC006193 TaxID=3155717 RepID=UPI0033B076A7